MAAHKVAQSKGSRRCRCSSQQRQQRLGKQPCLDWWANSQGWWGCSLGLWESSLRKTKYMHIGTIDHTAVLSASHLDKSAAERRAISVSRRQCCQAQDAASHQATWVSSLRNKHSSISEMPFQCKVVAWALTFKLAKPCHRHQPGNQWPGSGHAPGEVGVAITYIRPCNWTSARHTLLPRTRRGGRGREQGVAHGREQRAGCHGGHHVGRHEACAHN